MATSTLSVNNSTALFAHEQSMSGASAQTCQAWTAVAVALLEKVRSDKLSTEQVYAALQQAVAACEQAHRLDPADVDCLYRWGRANLLTFERAGEQAHLGWRLAQLAHAIRVFQLASTRDQQHVGALLGLGRAFSEQANLLLQQADDPQNVNATSTTNAAYASLQQSIVVYRRAYMAQMTFRAICGLSPPGTPTPGSVVSLEEEDTTSADALINTVISLIGVLVQLANLYAEQWEEDDEDDDDSDVNTRVMASHAVNMSETLYADAIHILSQAIVDVPDHRVELLAEWAEVLETMAKTRADRAGTLDPALFDEAIVKYEEAIEAAIAVNSELLADLHFDHGLLCHTIADTRLVELNTLHGHVFSDPSAISILHTIIRPYFDRACAAFRNAVQVSKGNAVMQERLGDACFVNATIAADSISKARLMAEAEYWYRMAMTADAEDDEVIARLAQLCYRQQRMGECVALLAHWQALGGTVQDLKREDRVFWPDFIAQVPLLMSATHQA